MIEYCHITNKYQFITPNHNVDNGSKKPLTYNQLFLNDQLHLLNTITGKLHINTIDLDMVNFLKQHNFCVGDGRFLTKLNGKIVRIHEIVLGIKSNDNYVFNHKDGDPSNNRRSNLELVTNWFNTVLRKKFSGLPIGILYANHSGSYKIQIRMPRYGESINFGAKSIDYLQNIHYQFATKSGLVLLDRYLQEVPNWLPDQLFIFTKNHQNKLDQLIAAHLENQSTWDEPKTPE